MSAYLAEVLEMESDFTHRGVEVVRAFTIDRGVPIQHYEWDFIGARYGLEFVSEFPSLVFREHVRAAIDTILE